MIHAVLRYLPRGNMLEDHAWRNRHGIVLWVLAIHLPAIIIFGLAVRADRVVLAQCWFVPLVCLVVGYLIHARRPASIAATAGLTWCSAAIVVLSGGSIEAHFHFFIIIGFIALYQDWVPFLWNIVFTVVSHGVGSAIPSITIFNHPSGQANPWVWSAIHGAAVLLASVGLVIFWRVCEEDQQARARLAHRIAEAEIGRRKFTSELLINLARRNQSMLYRQLDIINQLEEKERDPDALAELFTLDHLATRVRRNAESLMVLSGDTPARVWSAPVPLREVLQAAIAETADLDRVRFTVDERLAVAGSTVTDLTHLLAELAENAVRFSPPNTEVTLGVRPLPRHPGAQLVTIEDWGLGMRPEAIREANQLLAHPPEVDLSVSQRLGFHVVARLARRHDIEVSLTPTPGGGITAIVVLPSDLFAAGPPEVATGQPVPPGHVVPMDESRPVARVVAAAPNGGWARTSRSMPRQARCPVSPESLSPLSPASELSELAEIAVDQLSAAGSGSERHWDGWWTAERQPSPAQSPSPAGAPDPPADGVAPPADCVADDVADDGAGYGGAGYGGATDGGRVPELIRRRPQSHLAPELLTPRPTPYKRERPEIPDPRPTSEALSRYQASRRAAQFEAGQHGQSKTGGAR